MRTLLSTLALLSIPAIPLAAHADTLDLFTFTEGSTTLTFTIPGSPIPIGPTAENFVVNPVMATSNGVTANRYTEFFVGTAAAGGGLQIGLPDAPGPAFDLYGPVLFSGPTTAPTFLLGSFVLNDGIAGDALASLTISDASTAVTPEPSSFFLLGTGALGLFGVVRRRLA